jgi:hypothetical protein
MDILVVLVLEMLGETPIAGKEHDGTEDESRDERYKNDFSCNDG